MTVSSLKTGTESLGLLAGNLRVGNGFELLASTVLSSTASTVTFTSIPSTYKNLQIRAIARSSSNGNLDDIAWRFNGDTGTNYSVHYLYANGDGSVYATNGTNASNAANVRIAGATAISNAFGVGVIDIIDYSDTNKYKTIKTISGYDNNANDGSSQIFFSSSSWRSTSAITSIDLFSGNGGGRVFLQYSHFALYGIVG
jgi:hypothetical protein